jgi:flagellar export protein FliJ
MKKFRFKLDAVLQMRQHAETEAQRAFAAAMQVYEDIMAELRNAEAGHEHLALQLQQMATFRPAQHDMLWDGLKFQKQLCGKLRQKSEAAANEAAIKRQKLLKAQAETEALVRLREKQQREHARLAGQEETSMIDDIINARHAARLNHSF